MASESRWSSTDDGIGFLMFCIGISIMVATITTSCKYDPKAQSANPQVQSDDLPVPSSPLMTN